MTARAGFRFGALVKPRDVFFHDGKALRRIRVGSTIQFFGAFIVALTLFWSVFAAAQLVQAAAAPSYEDVARMEAQVAAMQADVDAIREVAQARYRLTAIEVKRLGLDPAHLQAQAGIGRGIGGPFEEAHGARNADPSFQALFTSWKQLEQLEASVIAIPSTRPVRGTELTSGFGVRSDPFRGRAAMHAGIDLAGPYGTPVLATADGVVGRTEYSGGYGNLVELDHGRGIQTRYGHLSRSLVRAGQKVKRGDVIALMGSTGRSTGSHLHYEVRIDGRAVNPVPFMQSSDYLQSVQRRAAATQVALGGPAAD